MSNPSRLKILEQSGPSVGLQLFSLRIAAALSGLLQNRGMQRFTWDLARLFDHRNAVVVELPSGGKLEVYLDDGYWSRVFLSNFKYEPDVDYVLRYAVTLPDIYFLDLGANIGYWSVVASKLLPPGRVLALEASPPQYERLSRNSELNDRSFEAIWGAVWQRDGDTLSIVTHDLRHAGASVVNRREKAEQPGYHKFDVQSITIDSICERYAQNPHAGIVIKLDVEDAEIQALAGAQSVLNSRSVLVLYEDHGQDASCRVSEYFLDKLEFDIFYNNEHNTLTRMKSVADVKNVKKLTSMGYNFCACTPDSDFSRMLTSLSH